MSALRISFCVLCFALATTLDVSQALQVGFLEYHKEDGSLLQLEPNGRFHHVAIKYNSKWLHAHSHRGVDLVERILDYGHRLVVLENPDLPPINAEDVWRWLGRPFDRTYDWTNPHATYCTRLVANLLGVPGQPMSFSAQIWSTHAHRPIGSLGLSPDDLYQYLLLNNFRLVDPCEAELKN